jgi:hypothetical protein
VGVLSNMVEERHRTTYCVRCREDTRQRYLVMDRGWLLFWTVISCGLFFPMLWFLGLGASKDTTCLRCGTLNGPPTTWWRRHYRWHQCGGRAAPPGE